METSWRLFGDYLDTTSTNITTTSTTPSTTLVPSQGLLSNIVQPPQTPLAPTVKVRGATRISDAVFSDSSLNFDFLSSDSSFNFDLEPDHPVGPAEHCRPKLI